MEVTKKNGVFLEKAISNNEIRLFEHDIDHTQSWQDLPQYLGLGEKVGEKTNSSVSVPYSPRLMIFAVFQGQ